jgi:ribosome-binding factor A
MKTRMLRINDEITRVTADIIRFEMSDPRIGSVVSVMRSETTRDLKHCKLFVSVLGDENEQKEVMTALKKAAGFIRKRIAEIINLRNTPELNFVLDDSIEYGLKMAKLIEEVNKPLKERGDE